MIPVTNIASMQQSESILWIRLRPGAQIPLVSPLLFRGSGGGAEEGRGKTGQQQQWVSFELSPEVDVKTLGEQLGSYYGTRYQVEISTSMSSGDVA